MKWTSTDIKCLLNENGTKSLSVALKTLAVTQLNMVRRRNEDRACRFHHILFLMLFCQKITHTVSLIPFTFLTLVSRHYRGCKP